MSVTDQNELKQLEGKGLHISAPAESAPDPAVNHLPADEVYSGQEYKASSTGSEEKKDSVGKDIAILVLITLAAGLLLGMAYSITEEPIARAQESARAEAQRMVMSQAESFEALYSADTEPVPDSVQEAIRDAGILTTEVSQIDAAYGKDGALAGYVVTASNPDGYGGDVEVMCGISPEQDGVVTLEGISFLSLSETAGMGMRAKDEPFASQFFNRKLKAGDLIVYTKNGASADNEIDAISGCTITTSAVTDDVNATLIAAQCMSEAGQGSPSEKTGSKEQTGQTEEKSQEESE